MKKSFIFKKIITSFLILTTFFVSSFSMYPETANAQLVQGQGNASGGFNVQGIGGVIANCGVKFFVQRKAAKLAIKGTAKLEEIAENAIGNASSTVIGVDITNPQVGSFVPTRDVDLPTVVKAENAAINAELEQQSFVKECLNLIARYIVLKIMDKITMMTVEWINSGFDGNPFYPEDRENFFEQLAKDEVTSFTAWFSANPTDYPFGKIISETILLSVQNTLQNNLRFSLNQVLQHQNQYANYESFQAQFSVGGWAGYSAFAEPQNNIFGNYMMANNHLARRTAGTNITLAANFQRQLAESGGLLNQQICRMTNTGNPADEYLGKLHRLHLGGYTEIPVNGNITDIMDLLPQSVQDELNTGLNSPEAQRLYYNDLVKRSHCKSWQTVTPGRFIAEKTSHVINGPFRRLELVDELNENLGLIFDAFAAQLFEQGLRKFQNSTGQYSSDPNSPNYNSVWAQSNDPNFGATSSQPTLAQAVAGDGVNPGLIQLQQEYLFLAEDNMEKISDIIRDIRALDYCVPGPNPTWYSTSYQNLLAFLPSIQEPFSGNSADDQQYYRNKIFELTGINIQPTPLVGNANQFNQFMVFVLNKYSDAIGERYSLNNTPPPTMRPTAANLYNQISSYQNSLDIYQNQINSLTAIMPQLMDIQSQLAALPAATQNDPNSAEMQVLSSLFSQVVSQGGMVNQSQYSQAQTDGLGYIAQLTYINGLINSCIAETTASSYDSGARERVFYPSQSILGNTAIMQNLPSLLSTTGDYFINGYQFGSGAGPQNINISTFGTGITVQSSSPASTFADFLQTVF